MKILVLSIMLIFKLGLGFAQGTIPSVEFEGNTYLLYPEPQDEKYMNDLSFWKANIIRTKYKLEPQQSIDGVWIQFYKQLDKMPAKIFELKNAQFNGEYIRFYENGNMESREHNLNGKKTGLKTSYYKNGNIRDSVKYRLDTAQNGHVFSNKISLKSFYENGRYKKIETYAMILQE